MVDIPGWLVLVGASAGKAAGPWPEDVGFPAARVGKADPVAVGISSEAICKRHIILEDKDVN